MSSHSATVWWTATGDEVSDCSCGRQPECTFILGLRALIWESNR